MPNIFDRINENISSSIDSFDVKANFENQVFTKSQDYQKKTFSDLYNKRYNLNTKLRSFLSLWAVAAVSFWLYSVVQILHNNDQDYCLSDSVLITLLTTTTVNVIGILLIVMHDIFNGKSEDKKETEKLSKMKKLLQI